TQVSSRLLSPYPDCGQDRRSGVWGLTRRARCPKGRLRRRRHPLVCQMLLPSEISLGLVLRRAPDLGGQFIDRHEHDVLDLPVEIDALLARLAQLAQRSAPPVLGDDERLDMEDVPLV